MHLTTVTRWLSLGILLSATQAVAHSDGVPLSVAEQQAAKGIFDNQAVKDRPLSDWDGVWQSVYPLLERGDLDAVFARKAQQHPGKSAAEIKEYYRQGYATNVDTINIENNRIEFQRGEQTVSCDYHYAGFKILTYVSGKKGVRYLFECRDPASHAPSWVQFSDHIIGPRKSAHFHIFTGNTSQQALLAEMKNWPTYYPYQLQNAEVVAEMLHH